MEDEPIVVANEFAEVVVRRRRTRNGTRLEIFAPKLGRGVALCPLELESLTWQPPDVFTSFLATPFGPEEAPDDGEGDRRGLA